jgi:hypothetical protein
MLRSDIGMRRNGVAMVWSPKRAELQRLEKGECEGEEKETKERDRMNQGRSALIRSVIIPITREMKVVMHEALACTGRQPSTLHSPTSPIIDHNLSAEPVNHPYLIASLQH